MVLAAAAERVPVGLAVLEVEDEQRQPFGPGVGPVVADDGFGGRAVGGGGEVQQLPVQQHVAGAVEFYCRPGDGAAGHYPCAEGVFQIFKEELLGRTHRFLPACHMNPFLEFHGLAGGVDYLDSQGER